MYFGKVQQESHPFFLLSCLRKNVEEFLDIADIQIPEHKFPPKGDKSPTPLWGICPMPVFLSEPRLFGSAL